MSRHNIKIKLWTEIEVDAKNKEEAIEKVWEALDFGVDIGISDSNNHHYDIKWIEISDVIVV